MPHRVPPLRITPRLWVVLPLGLLSGVPVGVAVGVLLFPDSTSNQLGGVVPGVVVASVMVMVSRWEYWRLPLTARRQIGRSVGTGGATGDARLDRLALLQLTELSSRANRVITPVLVVVLVAAPVAAAVRSSGWWLLAIPLPLMLFGERCRTVYAPDLLDRRARLAAAVHGH